MSAENNNLGYVVPDKKWRYDPEEVVTDQGMIHIPRYTMKAGNVSHTISANYFKTVFESNIASCGEDGQVIFSEEALEGLVEIEKFTMDDTFDRLLVYLLGNGRN